MQLHSIKINENYTYVGVNDRETERFEGQWPLPNGVSYNSYIVCGEKTALLDAVKVTKIDDFKEKIEEESSKRVKEEELSYQRKEELLDFIFKK